MHWPTIGSVSGAQASDSHKNIFSNPGHCIAGRLPDNLLSPITLHIPPTQQRVVRGALLQRSQQGETRHFLWQSTGQAVIVQYFAEWHTVSDPSSSNSSKTYNEVSADNNPICDGNVPASPQSARALCTRSGAANGVGLTDMRRRLIGRRI